MQKLYVFINGDVSMEKLSEVIGKVFCSPTSICFPNQTAYSNYYTATCHMFFRYQGKTIKSYYHFDSSKRNMPSKLPKKSNNIYTELILDHTEFSLDIATMILKNFGGFIFKNDEEEIIQIEKVVSRRKRYSA